MGALLRQINRIGKLAVYIHKHVMSLLADFPGQVFKMILWVDVLVVGLAVRVGTYRFLKGIPDSNGIGSGSGCQTRGLTLFH